MKIKDGFILRKLGTDNIVVAIGEASKSFNGMIRLNESGVFLWEQLAACASRDELLQKMLDAYDGLDVETASADLDEFLTTIEGALDD